MKIRSLYIIISALLLMFVMIACSDNNDPTLKPTSKERILILEAQGETTSDDATSSISLNILSEETTIPVKVVCNTFWEVEVSSSAWCSVDVVRGEGEGEFNITIPNNKEESRHFQISVYQIDSNGQPYDREKCANIVITQDANIGVYIFPSSLDIFPASNPNVKSFKVRSNLPWKLLVSYENEFTDDFVKIIPGNGMEESKASNEKTIYSGTMDADFSILLSNNGLNIPRKAYLEFETILGNNKVCINQEESDYAFDVFPNTTRTIVPEGELLLLNVYSPQCGWKVRANNPWIKCQYNEFDKSESRVTVNVNVECNLTGEDRAGIIYFIPDNTYYEPVKVEVFQRGYDMTFISSHDVSEVVMEYGGMFNLYLDSSFDWAIVTPIWVSANETKGLASNLTTQVSLTVEPNSSYSNRSGRIIVYPQITEYEGGVKFDPEKLGIQPIIVPITQLGSREVTIGVPWLHDGYSQTSATVEFNFYSPYYMIVEAGLEYRREDMDTAAIVTVSLSDATEGTVSFELTDLEPLSRYVTRGYVKDEDGRIIYGKWSYPFTTAGR
ncbi:MAG: hypothetical protein K2L22_10690 [Muribaculaceae bacterium]|nr:hypothetical protein [Muribaculaceae bacterium]